MPTAAEQQQQALQNAGVIAAIAEGVTTALKQAGTTPLAINPHGPGGLLSTPGLEPDVVNAMPRVMSGLQAVLPWRASNQINPILPVLTGQTASSGTEPTQACVGGPKPGNLKVCQRTHPFGRLTMESNVFRIDTAGEQVNRGEFLDQRLIGNPFANLDAPASVSPEQALRNQGAKVLMELFVAMTQRYRHLIFDGNPANTSGSQGYIEYNGLDRLVNTGYRDAITGAVCPAVDSVVVNYGGQNIVGGTGNIVDTLTELVYYLTYLAEQLGLNPVEFGLVMRPGLFHKLTEIWPCNYLTYRCNIGSGTGNQITYDGAEAIRMRDEMRNGNYLMMDGRRIRIILDEAMAETIPGAAGTYESSIYVVPLTFAGNRPATYMEFFNWRGPNAAASIIQERKLTTYYDVSPEGRYLLHYQPPTYWCNQVAVLERPRLVVEAPMLAARITGIRYSYSFHERSPFPGDPYFRNGGSTTNTGQQLPNNGLPA